MPQNSSQFLLCLGRLDIRYLICRHRDGLERRVRPGEFSQIHSVWGTGSREWVPLPRSPIWRGSTRVCLRGGLPTPTCSRCVCISGTTVTLLQELGFGHSVTSLVFSTGSGGGQSTALRSFLFQIFPPRLPGPKTCIRISHCQFLTSCRRDGAWTQEHMFMISATKLGAFIKIYILFERCL